MLVRRLPLPMSATADPVLMHPGAGGRLAYVLEGGYSSEGLAASCVATFLGLLHLPPPAELDPSVEAEPQQEVEDMLNGLKRLHGL